MMILLLAALVALLVDPSLSAESFFARCPSAPVMEDFDMEKFLGLWYVVETFNYDQKCITWNITRGDAPGLWHLTEAMESGAFYAVGLDHSTFNEADLTVPNSKQPAKMRIKWPLSIAGDAAFTVHKTDYESYAGVFECQNVGIFHRQNGVVLSRTPILQTNLRQMARVGTDSIKVEYFQRVKQGNCDYRYKKKEEETEEEGEEGGDRDWTSFLGDGMSGAVMPGGRPGKP